MLSREVGPALGERSWILLLGFTHFGMITAEGANGSCWPPMASECRRTCECSMIIVAVLTVVCKFFDSTRAS